MSLAVTTLAICSGVGPTFCGGFRDSGSGGTRLGLGLGPVYKPVGHARMPRHDHATPLDGAGTPDEIATAASVLLGG